MIEEIDAGDVGQPDVDEDDVRREVGERDDCVTSGAGDADVPVISEQHLESGTDLFVVVNEQDAVLQRVGHAGKCTTFGRPSGYATNQRCYVCV